MHNVLPYISVSPCSQVLDTELDSHCTMLHFLLHNVFSHQIFVDIFHNCNVLPILLLPLLIPLLSFNYFNHYITLPIQVLSRMQEFYILLQYLLVIRLQLDVLLQPSF